MSALGHKRTCALQNVMSALPPEADMCSAPAHVCFVPIADIAPLFGRYDFPNSEAGQAIRAKAHTSQIISYLNL